MNKEEILEKSRMENKNQDERERTVAAQANTYGMLGMAVIFIILFLIRFFVKGGNAYDLFAMYFGFIAVSSVYRWKVLGGKAAAVSAVMMSVITVIWMVLYIIYG